MDSDLGPGADYEVCSCPARLVGTRAGPEFTLVPNPMGLSLSRLPPCALWRLHRAAQVT